MAKRILIITDFYLPGVNAGGPVSSIFNMAKVLSSHNEIKILTRNRDWNIKEPYQGIENNSWSRLEFTRVYYFSTLLYFIRELIRERDSDYVIINSVYSRLSIITLLVKALNIVRGKMILFPRGELSNEAIRNKRFSKTFCLWFYRMVMFLIDSDVIATNKVEGKMVERKLAKAPLILSNIPRRYERFEPNFVKEKRLLFVGRIDRIKALDKFIEYLPDVEGLVFDLCGPEKDKSYVKRLQEVLLCKQNTRINFLGRLSWDKLGALYSHYHFIVLPSYSENFGHSLFEGMSAGLVPVVSTGVPLSMQIKDFEAGLVFDINSSSDSESVLQTLTNMSNDDLRKFQRSSQEVYRRNIQDIEKDYLNIFK